MQSKFWRSAALAALAVFAAGATTPTVAADVKGAAASPARPSEEARALGVQLAHYIFQLQDLDGTFSKVLTGPLGGMAQYEPAWPGLMLEAMKEEMAAKAPQIEAAFGETLSGYFTVEELRTGVKVLGDPAMQTYLRELWAGRSTEGLIEKVPAPIAKLYTGPEGRRFYSKFQGLGEVMGPFTTRFLDLVIPGVYRRLADKLDAEVASRRGANP